VAKDNFTSPTLKGKCGQKDVRRIHPYERKP